MKIDKKEFNKLKQLDRIEYIQKFQEIRNKYILFELIIMSCLFLMMCNLTIFWIFPLMFSMYLVFKTFMNKKKMTKDLKELQKQYFKIEVK